MVETEPSNVETGPHIEGCRDRQFALEEFESARLVTAFRSVVLLNCFLPAGFISQTVFIHWL